MIVTGESKMQYENVAAGTHAARCVRVIDLGTQEKVFQGDRKMVRQVKISWELPNTKMVGGEYAGQPFMVSKTYTASLADRANLRKDLEVWRGKKFTDAELKGFDITKLLGVPCMINVTIDDGYSNVRGVMAVPQGMTVPAQINPSVKFSFDDFDENVLNSLHQKMQEKIKLSPEYLLVTGGTGGTISASQPASSPQPSPPDDFYNDDVPF